MNDPFTDTPEYSPELYGEPAAAAYSAPQKKTSRRRTAAERIAAEEKRFAALRAALLTRYDEQRDALIADLAERHGIARDDADVSGTVFFGRLRQAMGLKD